MRGLGLSSLKKSKMKKLIVDAVSFPYEYYVEGKGRPIIESDKWHGVSAAM